MGFVRKKAAERTVQSRPQWNVSALTSQDVFVNSFRRIPQTVSWKTGAVGDEGSKVNCAAEY